MQVGLSILHMAERNYGCCSVSYFRRSPLNGATIYKPSITVTGAIINSTGNETGVTVNDIPASVYSTRFTANNVLLTEGENIITITATDTAGTTASTSITVNAVTTGNHIKLTSNIDSGIAPLGLTLRIDGSFSIDNSKIGKPLV